MTLRADSRQRVVPSLWPNSGPNPMAERDPRWVVYRGRGHAIGGAPNVRTEAASALSSVVHGHGSADCSSVSAPRDV